MAPRRATPRSLPERRTSPGARPVPYSTVRIRRSEQYRPPRAGRLSAARVCEVHKRKFTAKSVSAHSPPVRRFFSSARRPNRQTWHNPLAESRFSVSALGKNPPLLESPIFGLDSRLPFFPNSPAGKWVGRRLRNQTWDPMWHGGAPGRDWLKKKTMTEQTVQGLRGELPIRRETGDWRPYGTRIGLGAHPEPRAGVQLAKRGPRDSAIRGPDPSRTLNAHARFHAPLSLKWPLSLPPPPP